MIEFILNNQAIKTEQPPGSTVLDFVRYHKKLTGTKIGCREGDCGACTILVGAFENNTLVYRNVTSCLMPLINAQGKHIVTIEGINQTELTPVQQAMVDSSGTQCGFCTIGFVMSLTGFVMNQTQTSFTDAIKNIDGNICRCTGYKSIEKAAKILSTQIENKPTHNTLNWLTKNKYLPDYFLGIEERLRKISIQQYPENKSAIKLGGATDLNVQKHQLIKKSAVQNLYDNASLKTIETINNEIILGASVTVAQFAESSIIQPIFPNLNKHIKLVSSTPIRNMATLAGNFVNASPIGDMTAFFIALDASIIFNTNRKIKLKDFYKGYKLLDKAEDEIIEKIVFSIPSSTSFFNFEKVCKRTHLDIASVNTACLINIDDNNIIQQIHLSAGGVAPYPKYLSNTCSFLLNKPINKTVLQEAITIMQQEIAPISDARGTTEYKKLLLRQLFLAHFAELNVEINFIIN
ncbi:MAG: FAD binding domain-containing protein [Bacteroidetes bacterium]|nr:FAD binding domain-containing protein [Bacteroidota bacterium]MBS1648704.1 FAD binding domain-containing protein [Bacteroidota bacterium]